jgi:nucleotide-binding universal stress UspA family protein
MEPVPLEMDWQKQRAAECMSRLEGFEPLRLYPHQTVLTQGNPWLEMSGVIGDAGIDLVVMGTHGRGVIGTLVLGSVAEQVLRQASCPVLTVGPEVAPSLVDHDKLSHILFATDFSEGSMHACGMPYHLQRRRTMLNSHSCMCWWSFNRLCWSTRSSCWLTTASGCGTWCRRTDHVVQAARSYRDWSGSRGNCACPHERMVDLIVMGVHSGGMAATHLPWTVVHSVVRHTRCPVLTTRGSTA